MTTHTGRSLGDIESKMLMALTDEVTTEMRTINVDEMIKFLKKYVNVLPVNDRKALGKILIQNGRASALRPCEEGTVIHLDPLPAGIIEKMYCLVSDRMKHSC